MKGWKVNNSRQSRRVFASKARPGYSQVKREFLMRGGGYL